MGHNRDSDIFFSRAGAHSIDSTLPQSDLDVSSRRTMGKGLLGSAVNIGSHAIVRRIESLHIVDNNIVPYNCIRPWGRGKISLAAMPPSAVSFSSLCFLLSPSPSRTGPIMDRLPGFELPYEPLPTSYRVRATAGATHQATGDHWEPQNAHLDQILKQIQAGRGPSEGGHGCSAPD